MKKSYQSPELFAEDLMKQDVLTESGSTTPTESVSTKGRDNVYTLWDSLFDWD